MGMCNVIGSGDQQTGCLLLITWGRGGGKGGGGGGGGEILLPIPYIPSPRNKISLLLDQCVTWYMTSVCAMQASYGRHIPSYTLVHQARA